MSESTPSQTVFSADNLEIRPMSAGACCIDNPAYQAGKIIAKLAADAPESFSDLDLAICTLNELQLALRQAADALWATSADKQAILSQVSVLVEAGELLSGTLTDLEKAKSAAIAVLQRSLKKLQAPRTEQRVWLKLRQGAST